MCDAFSRGLTAMLASWGKWLSLPVLLPFCALATDLTVTTRNGSTFHFGEAALHVSTYLGTEKRGIIVSVNHPPAPAVLPYTEHESGQGIVGRTIYYVPWTRIREVTLAKSPSDPREHPQAKVTFTDGVEAEVRIVIDPAFPLLIGKTKNGKPLEPSVPFTWLAGGNSCIFMSKVAKLTPSPPADR
jgi:hypothetical protein